MSKLATQLKKQKLTGFNTGKSWASYGKKPKRREPPGLPDKPLHEQFVREIRNTFKPDVDHLRISKVRLNAGGYEGRQYYGAHSPGSILFKIGSRAADAHLYGDQIYVRSASKPELVKQLRAIGYSAS